MKKKYHNVKEIWEDVDNGKEIFWHNKGYKLFVEPSNNSNQVSFRDGKCLTVRYVANYFGSILHYEEIKHLFSE